MKDRLESWMSEVGKEGIEVDIPKKRTLSPLKISFIHFNFLSENGCVSQSLAYNTIHVGFWSLDSILCSPTIL